MGKQARMKAMRREQQVKQNYQVRDLTAHGNPPIRREVKEMQRTMELGKADELTQQARIIVMNSLKAASQLAILDDQPWKRSAKRLLAGKDIKLGELTEILRALEIDAFLTTAGITVETKNARMAFADVKHAMMWALLANGETVNGITFTEDEKAKCNKVLKDSNEVTP